MSQKCNRCKKPIKGVVKIITRRKKSGKQIIQVVEYYDEDCFFIKNKESATDGRKNKKRTR